MHATLYQTRKTVLTSNNAKTIKGEKYNIKTKILYLAPFDTAISGFNICPDSSSGCREDCLYLAGRGQMNSVQTARINKTKWLYYNSKSFTKVLLDDLQKLSIKAFNNHLIKYAVRLDGTSDISQRWFKYMSLYPLLQFYDYTKSYNKADKYLNGLTPDNYHLTFSRNENNNDDCLKLIERGINIAVVFRDSNFPKYFKFDNSNKKYEVLNGDDSDLRFLDKGKGVIIGLKAKGKMKHNHTGMVVDT